LLVMASPAIEIASANEARCPAGNTRRTSSGMSTRRPPEWVKGLACVGGGANASPAIAPALGRRRSVASLGDHHIRCLDHRKRIIADLESRNR
jgi:hypothetical protein